MKLKIIALIILLMPFLTFAQNTEKKKAYFFYLDSCSHCHNVDDYFSENGIYEKYEIKKLNAQIPQNGEFMMKLYGVNGYPEEQRGGVPVVAFSDKFFVGDKPVIDNFVNEIEASQIADQLPNPNQDGQMPDIVVHDGQITDANSPAKSITPKQDETASATAEGNKNNYFPVIIAVLVVVGAGALIFANRKS